VTGVKVFEYKMTNAILKDIVKENLIAEYTNDAKTVVAG
jgi:hypothetical protein